MSRIALIPEQKKDHMIADLAGWIVGRMHLLGLNQEDVAKELGITHQALSTRLKKRNNGKPKDVFSYGDLLTIFKLLGATDEEKQRFMTL